MAKSKQVLALANLNVGHRRPVGPNQSRQMQNLAAVSHAWKNLPLPARAQWQLLANQMRHDTGLRTPAGLKQKRPMNAFQCFASLNATRLTCGLPISTAAPAAVAKPNALPPLLLSATSTADATPVADPTALPFTLTITAPAYQGTLQIYAAAPLLAGQGPAAQKSVIIATWPALTSGPNDLAPAYAARFGPLMPGQQIALSLVPVSPAGFKGTPLSLTADVNPPAQTARRRGDAPPALKAA